MKKVMSFIVCLMVITILSSCGNGVEAEAKNSMEALMKSLAKNPKSLEIENVKTIFKSDSCVVLKYKACGQNGFGGYSKGEYVYIFSVYKFNKIGEKKMHALLQIDSGDEKTSLHRFIWKQLENDINTKSNDSINASITALEVLFGSDIETSKNMIEILN